MTDWLYLVNNDCLLSARVQISDGLMTATLHRVSDSSTVIQFSVMRLIVADLTLAVNTGTATITQERIEDYGQENDI